MRSTLTTVIVGATLALTGGVAHATETPTTPGPPTIFMLDTARDSGHGAVTTTCEGGQPLIHTVLYNDHGGPAETVIVYLEPTGPLNTLGIPVQNNQPSPAPITIPAGGHFAITLPYENGHAVFNAVAVAQGGTAPTTDQELAAAKRATPPTADNSQLFPPGGGTSGKYEYAIAPTACTPPPQTACPPNWPISPYPIEDPACIPHPKAVKVAAATAPATATSTSAKPVTPEPTVTKTVTKNTTATVTATSTITATATATVTAPGETVTKVETGGAPFPGDQAAESATAGTTPVASEGETERAPNSPGYAALVAVLLLLAFGVSTLMLAARRARRH